MRRIFNNWPDTRFKCTTTLTQYKIINNYLQRTSKANYPNKTNHQMESDEKPQMDQEPENRATCAIMLLELIE